VNRAIRGTFSGFRSRYMMPRPCKYSMPGHPWQRSRSKPHWIGMIWENDCLSKIDDEYPSINPKLTGIPSIIIYLLFYRGFWRNPSFCIHQPMGKGHLWQLFLLIKSRWLKGRSSGECEEVSWFVVSTPLKNISQLGLFFPIYGTIKFMFQTTNQYL